MPSHSASPPTQHRLVQHFRTRTIGSCAAIAVLTLLVQQILLSAQLVRVADRMPMGGEYLAREISTITLDVLATSSLLILPLVLAVALSASSRIQGWIGNAAEEGIPSPPSAGSAPAKEDSEARDAA